MDGESSLAELLCVLVDLPRNTPATSTISFAGWTTGDSSRAEAHKHSDQQRLFLIDTRDRSARRFLARIHRDSERVAGALILSGSGPGGSPLRRWLRRVRRPGGRRIPERQLRGKLPGGLSVTRLAFDDSREVPANFVVDGRPDSSGAAFLLTRRPPFDGPLWSLVRKRFSSGVVLQRLQLRERGAAIVMVRDVDREYVIRIIPPGRLQNVVLRNAVQLADLRSAITSHRDLLDLLPDPVFTEFQDGVAVLAETCLKGELAWKVASGSLSGQIHSAAIRFLDLLRLATVTTVTADAAVFIHPDVQRVRSASVVKDSVRSRIEEILTSACSTLSARKFRPSASHGDFGYGNVLVDPADGSLTGVIDWDTARSLDLPGVDRVNLEIQIARNGGSFAEAVRMVWDARSAHDALMFEDAASNQRGEWALFTVAVCRYILRATSYPAVYSRESQGFARALSWMEFAAPP